MTVLLRTHEALDRLLDLLRCDHCNSTLHHPFTTGVCEHLLCSNCRLGECAPKKSTGCPVCRVPVHPRDFQMHPQVAQLVLVARRLKKLMVDSGPAGSPQESSNTVDRPKETLQETDLDAFTSPFKESLETALKPAVASVKDESFLEPRVVLKRAYSSTSSVKSLPAPSNRKRGNSVDPDFLVADSQSSANGYPGRDSGSVASEPASNVSVTHKPRLTRDRSSTSSSQSTVTRLPAYRKLGCTLTTQNARQRQHFPSTLSIGPSSDQNSEVRHTPPHSVNSDSMEMVLRAATHVHQTRGSLRRGVCLDVTSVSNLPVPVPIASPEDTRITDMTHLSSENIKPPKEALPITPETVRGDFQTESRESFVRQSSRLKSNKKRHPADNISADSKTTRLKPSSSFLRFVQKLRPNSKGESVLHRAAIRGNLDQVKSLLASGLSPNVRDHAGWMPLHEAVLHGHRDVAEALLKAGATVDAPGGPDLDTPLHDAIQNAQAACCELLLAYGANPVLPNAMGMTPLQLVDSQLNRLALSSPKSKRHLPSVDPKNAAIVNQLHNVRIALLKAISQPRTSANTDKREANTHKLIPDLISLVKTVNQTTFIERRRLRPVLLATGLSRPQQATFARVATMIHAQIATSISPEVTHVITGASQEIVGMDRPGQMSLVRTSTKPRGRVNTNPSTGAYQANCPRTLKFLNAVLQGCWVLSFDWIETCAHVKMRVEEEGFEVTGCSTTPHSGAPRRARLAREAGSLGLFHGFRFCFLGPFVYPVPPRAELVALARSGGAAVVLSRERCSPLRLARLAVEVADLSATSSSCASWEVIESSSFGAIEEDHEEDGDGDRSAAHDTGTLTSNTVSSPLLVFYDPGQHSTLAHAKTAQATPYAVQTVSQALTLLKPRADRVSSADPPLRAVPSTWLLDCAAEYTILPFPNL